MCINCEIDRIILSSWIQEAKTFDGEYGRVDDEFGVCDLTASTRNKKAEGGNGRK